MTLVDRMCLQWKSITGKVPKWKVWPDRTDLQIGHLHVSKSDISLLCYMSDEALGDWLRAHGVK